MSSRRILAFLLLVLVALAFAACSKSGVCEKAEKCCRVAMPALGAECDVEFQLGDRTAARCEAAMRGFLTLLEAKQIEIPAECK